MTDSNGFPDFRDSAPPGADHIMVTEETVTWVSISGEMSKLLGMKDAKVGVDRTAVLNKPVWLEGWRLSWCIGPLAVTRDDGTQAFAPMPMLIVNIPDYPTEDGVSLVIALPDASQFISALARERKELANTVKGWMRRVERQFKNDSAVKSEARKAEKQVTRCSVEGCHRTRVFFDESNVGYCKRHAEELGIRPHGKIGES